MASLTPEATRDIDERYFHRPECKADLAYWARKALWTLDEAVALSFGKEPEAANLKAVSGLTSVSYFAADYVRRYELLQSAIKANPKQFGTIAVSSLPSDLVPIRVIEWAQQQGEQFVMPEELRRLSAPADTGLTKRERQIRAIEAAADAMGFQHNAIPDGGKKKLMEYCKAHHRDLFGAGDNPFMDAWKTASRNDRISMANRSRYVGGGK